MGADDHNNDIKVLGKWYIHTQINCFFRWLDDIFGGTQTVPWFHGRSLLAFLLPIPVYLFIVLGPSLARNAEGGIVWRGGYAAVLLIAGAVILQLVYFLQKRWRGMAWLHLGLITALSLATLILGKDSVQASSNLYRHYYGLLAWIAVVIAVPVAALLRYWKLLRLPDDAIKQFQDAFNAKRVVDQGNPKPCNIWDIIGAFVIVLLRRPLHVVAPAALVVVVASPIHLTFWAGIALFLSLVLFSVANYDPQQDAFVRLFQHTFLSGGTLLVTLAVIVLAVLRLADVDYVTTILNAGSNLTIFSYILSTYALFWFYDFWVDQATLDLLGRIMKSSKIQRHGGGRIAVISPPINAKNNAKKRMFEPASLLMRIAQTAPETDREKLQNEADRAEQRFRILAGVCLVVFAGVICLIGAYLHRLNQEPGLTATNAPTERSYTPFNLAERLMTSSEPVIMLAASGGGTRAALYTTAVLHALARLGKLDQLVLASGVSGGSAALAYFAINKPTLGNDEAKWAQMSETLASPFIDDVLAGAAEWRVVSRVRLGQLLTESFERRFLTDALSAGSKHPRTTIGNIEELGLIFNTSLCGAPALCDGSNQESALCAEERLVITNLASQFDRKPIPGVCAWGPDLPFEIVHDPSASLCAAAALSANFPPVFSNAAVAIDGKYFWVTDGGAVENRGILSILLALAEALETIRTESGHSGNGQSKLAQIRIVVADASAFQPNYMSDRGLDAKSGAAQQIANRLISDLIKRVQNLHASISGVPEGIRVIYLPMPDAMRAAGTFGTHWMMPSSVMINNPLACNGDSEGVVLEKEQLKKIIDLMVSKDYSIAEIRRRWPELDAVRITKEIKQLWSQLEACLNDAP